MVQLEKDRAAAEEAEELALAAAKAGVEVGGASKQSQQKALVDSAEPLKKKTYNEVRKDFYNRAHTVEEEVATQPQMLRFGVLREYQVIAHSVLRSM
jgi:hypothetical protein